MTCTRRPRGEATSLRRPLADEGRDTRGCGCRPDSSHLQPLPQTNQPLLRCCFHRSRHRSPSALTCPGNLLLTLPSLLASPGPMMDPLHLTTSTANTHLARFEGPPSAGGKIQKDGTGDHPRQDWMGVNSSCGVPREAPGHCSCPEGLGEICVS